MIVTQNHAALGDLGLGKLVRTAITVHSGSLVSANF